MFFLTDNNKVIVKIFYTIIKSYYNLMIVEKNYATK